MNRQHIIAGILAAMLCPMVMSGRVLADDDGEKSRGEKRSNSAASHDQALEALRRNEIKPLAEIQAAAERAMPGQVVGVEIKRKGGRLIYEFKIIAAKGRVREVYVDATTLAIIKIE